MEAHTLEEIRHMVAQRAPIDDTPALGFEADSNGVHFEIILTFTFWPKFKTFIAYPMQLTADGGGVVISVQMPDEWKRYLKHELRVTLGVRHLHNINERDNSKRIEKLLGLKHTTHKPLKLPPL